MIRLLTETDRPLILKYLERNEIETSFLYANIVEAGINNRKEIRRCGDYYGFIENGELRGIIPFYNLGSCIPHYETKEAIPLFAQLMKERAFNAVMGMDRIVKPLYEQIKSYKEIQEYNESIYFINERFTPFIKEGMQYMEAGVNINDEVIHFIIHARANGFHQIASPEDIRKTLEQKGKEEDFLIAMKDGKMVAQACVQAYTNKISQIGGVYTLEEERGNGYCKAVVSELCRRIMKRGKTPTLFAIRGNIPAVKAYTALGFQYYDGYLLIKCK